MSTRRLLGLMTMGLRWRSCIMMEVMLMLSLLVTSCAVLSKSQQERIADLSVLGGEVVKAPSLIVQDLAEARRDRGLFYASTLSAAPLHVQELEAVYGAYEEDLKLARKFDAGIGFLRSYVYQLKSLSNERRWKEYGTEIRSLSRTLSRSIEEMNDLGWLEEECSADLVKAAGYSTASLTQSIVRRRQMSLLRDYVRQGDTLVNIAVDSMVLILKSERLSSLIENEEKGLRENYESFLKRMPEGNVSLVWDRAYLDARSRIGAAKKMRRSCVLSLQAFKRAHHRMVEEISKRKDVREVFDEFTELAQQSARLMSLIEREVKD